MSAYYNDNEPYAAQWLRNLITAGLIPGGEVDERSIADVQGDDLVGFTHCHFFAGIGGWALAARLVDWPDDRPLWTGSCPCQPFSVAGQQRGFDDERHLWPEFYRLIAQCRPAIVFGEQVARAPAWLVSVRSDLEALDYAVGAVPIEAACAGAQHLRDRYWFVADTDGPRLEIKQPRQAGKQPASLGAHTWPYQSSVGSVAYGIPARVAKLRALGNAIVPQVAAEVIRAYMDCRP